MYPSYEPNNNTNNVPHRLRLAPPELWVVVVVVVVVVDVAFDEINVPIGVIGSV
jgi:hypothetical protein